jgi:hypothetical protein
MGGIMVAEQLIEVDHPTLAARPDIDGVVRGEVESKAQLGEQGEEFAQLGTRMPGLDRDEPRATDPGADGHVGLAQTQVVTALPHQQPKLARCTRTHLDLSCRRSDT